MLCLRNGRGDQCSCFRRSLKVIQKVCAIQEAEVILIAPWWSTQLWFPHLLRLCVDHPLFFLYRRDLLSQQGQRFTSDGKSYICKAAGLSDEVFSLAAAPRRLSTNRMYEDKWLSFTHWAAREGFDPLSPTAAQIAAFLYSLFNTHGLSPQTVKTFRTCLGSVLNRTGKAKVVQHKTFSI